MIRQNTRPIFLLFFLILTGAGATYGQGTPWAPYFGNTHFGYPLGDRDSARMPSAVKLADIDNDGDLDAVIAHNGNSVGFEESSGFTVLLNDHNGHYGKPRHYATGSASEDLVIGDFNRDGKKDVVVTNTGFSGADSTLVLFNGLGNGQFITMDTIGVGRGPAGLAAADFNGDGYLDLAVANRGRYFYEDSTISILMNTGTGGFAMPITIQANFAPGKIAAGRIDADTLPDLVVANGSHRFTVLRNTGASFAPDPVYKNPDSTNWAGDDGSCVALADVENDGDLDVLYSSSRTWNGNNGQVILRRNTGTGTLDTAETINLGGFSGGTMSLLAVDINHDSLPDLISQNGSGRTGDGYRVMLNQGNGRYDSVTVRPGGQWTAAVGVGDVDGDNSLDVVTLDQYSLEMTVHINKGDGQFPTPDFYSHGVPYIAGNLEVADIDRDGDLDILASGDSRAAISVSLATFLNTGTGGFVYGQQITNAAVQVKARDLNNDSLPDLLYSAGGRFSTARNMGSGQFATPVSHSAGVCGAEDIDAADMDLDGDMDVVVSGGCGGGEGIQIAWNVGTGGNIAFDTVSSYDVSGFGGPLALGDYNWDGIPDIATGVGDELVLLLSDSIGTYHPVRYDMGGSPYDILVEDLNDDGILDLASCNYGSTVGSNYSMSVRMGVFGGTLGALQILPAAYSPDLANVSGIACGDIDDDGDLDIMVANNATNDMSVYLNRGNSTFDAALRAGLYYGCRSPWFADFNGDGHSEVAALVGMPPSGGQTAIVILQGTNSGFRTGGTGRVFVGNKERMAASARLGLRAQPNPFSQSTEIGFSLPKAGPATLTVYNLMGQAVATPLSATLPAGAHAVPFRKGSLPPGTYMARLVTGMASKTLTLVVE